MRDPIIRIVQALIVAGALVVSVFLVADQLGGIGRFQHISRNRLLDTKTGDVWRANLLINTPIIGKPDRHRR